MRAIAVALLATVVLSSKVAEPDYVAQFETFKTTYNRKYESSSEEASRLGIFVRNMQKAAVLQSRNPHAKFGVNEYADLSEEEFKTRHNSEAHYRSYVRRRQSKIVKEDLKLRASQPSAIDWRNYGAVTQVKNQGQCGSCWSFSTTGNIEGQWAIAGNTLVSLSEQELVSCDTTCNGCNGGLMDNAFDWIVDAQGGGITAAADWPYVSGQGYIPPCQGGLTPAAYISGHQDVAHSEGAMSAWLGSYGPLSIGVDASSWQSYGGGVMTDCTSNQVDHGVLAVGYDLSANPPYWIIKNSWGPGWGESGYIRVEYGANECLITTAPSSSIAGSGSQAKKGEPKH